MEDILFFLTMEQVLELHQDALEQFGGLEGFKDYGLVDSAVAMPKATFGGEYLHPDLIAMAAAYMFHLCSNHGFTDGNKRVGVAAALVFLDANGIEPILDPQQLEAMALGIADHLVSKAVLTEWFYEQLGRR